MELGQFYQRSRESGTVLVTMKRSKPRHATDGENDFLLTKKSVNEERVKKLAHVKKTSVEKYIKPSSSKDDTRYPCIVRAEYKGEKISTLVSGNIKSGKKAVRLTCSKVSVDEFDRFQSAYSTVVRAYMDSLKKRERKSKKAKKTANNSNTQQ